MTTSTYKDMGESHRSYAEQKMLYTKRVQILYMKFYKGQIYLELWLSRGKRITDRRHKRIPGDVEMFNIVIEIIWIYPFKKIL